MRPCASIVKHLNHKICVFILGQTLDVVNIEDFTLALFSLTFSLSDDGYQRICLRAETGPDRSQGDSECDA